MQQEPADHGKRYKIVFWGELLPNHDRLSVKARLSNMFEVPGPMAELLFPGKPVLVRTNLPLEKARLYKQEFEKCGAACQLLEVSEKPVPPAQATSYPGEPAPRPGIRAEAPGPDYLRPRDDFSLGNKPKKKSGKWLIPVFLCILVLVFFMLRNMSNRDIDTESGKGADANSKASTTPHTFKDPSGFFTVTLPAGFKIDDQLSGQKSYISFIYPGDTDITVGISAEPMGLEWDAQALMDTRVQEVESGTDEEFPGFRLLRHGKVTMRGSRGFELAMIRGEDFFAHEITLRTQTDNIIVIRLAGPKSTMFQRVNRTVRNTMVFH